MSNSCNKTACDEYRSLSRRGFLGVSAAAMAAAATAPAWLPRVSVAASHSSAAQDVIVSLYLRGGADALSIVSPYNEPWYRAARPLLALPMPGTTANRPAELGSPASSPTAPGGLVRFSLHSALRPLLRAYNNNHLLFVHSCGMSGSNKSHFDSQKYMELGRWADPFLVSGWLGRHLATAAPMSPSALVRAVGIADGLQRTLAGAPRTLPVGDLSSDPGVAPLLENFTGYRLSGRTGSSARRLSTLGELYQAAQQAQMRAAAESTINTMSLLNQIGATGYAPADGVSYPSTPLGNALRSTAALISAEVGVEAVAVDQGGWDTHLNQGVASGTTPGESFYDQCTTLAGALSAFYRDVIETRQKNVTVVIMSEFGRRVGENGSIGTDHGYGGMMMVLGRSVNGGRVLTNWAGIEEVDPPTEQDLAVTIDYRDVLAEVVQQRLGNSNLAAVFPGYTPVMRGVLL